MPITAHDHPSNLPSTVTGCCCGHSVCRPRRRRKPPTSSESPCSSPPWPLGRRQPQSAASSAPGPAPGHFRTADGPRSPAAKTSSGFQWLATVVHGAGPVARQVYTAPRPARQRHHTVNCLQYLATGRRALRPSGLFSCRLHSLELSPGFHPRPDHQCRLFQTFA